MLRARAPGIGRRQRVTGKRRCRPAVGVIETQAGSVREAVGLTLGCGIADLELVTRSVNGTPPDASMAVCAGETEYVPVSTHA